jgi:hypothetical protein
MVVILLKFKECRDTRTFSNLKSTHCTLLILLIINLVTKTSLCIVSKVQSTFACRHRKEGIKIQKQTSQTNMVVILLKSTQILILLITLKMPLEVGVDFQLVL